MTQPPEIEPPAGLDPRGPTAASSAHPALRTLPVGHGRRLLGDLVSREEHAAFVRSLDDDPDLATT